MSAEIQQLLLLPPYCWSVLLRVQQTVGTSSSLCAGDEGQSEHEGIMCFVLFSTFFPVTGPRLEDEDAWALELHSLTWCGKLSESSWTEYKKASSLPPSGLAVYWAIAKSLIRSIIFVACISFPHTAIGAFISQVKTRYRGSHVITTASRDL